jgi:hypothetical protein
VFEVSRDGKMQKEFTGSEMIGNIPEPVELFAEVCHQMQNNEQACINNPIRKSLVKSSKQMTRTKSLESSTFLKSFHGPMVFRSSSLLNEYAVRILWKDILNLPAL